MAKLADFLEELSSDEAFERAFDKQPQKTMQDFGLDAHQIDLVQNGTAKQIRQAVKEEDPTGQVVVFRVKRG